MLGNHVFIGRLEISHPLIEWSLSQSAHYSVLYACHNIFWFDLYLLYQGDHAAPLDRHEGTIHFTL